MRTDASRQWISKTIESSYNAGVTGGTNYDFIPTREPLFVLPVLEKLTDGDRIGRNAPSHVCNNYWTPMELGLRDDVETGVPARLFRRALGGTVTDTTVDTGVYDHEFAILAPQVGDVLPSFAVATILGNASYMHHGCVVDRFKLMQQGSERVQYEADVISSGRFTNPHELTSLPDLTAPPCMDGFRTEVTYTDHNSDPVDLSTNGTIISWEVEHRNNHRRDKRRVGDGILTVGDGAGAYVKKLPRGKYETTINMLVDFANITDWTNSVANRVNTNLKITVKGPVISGSYRHEFEVIVPRFTFGAVTPGDDNGDAATPISIICLEDTVTAGTITGRIRNATATLV